MSHRRWKGARADDGQSAGSAKGAMAMAVLQDQQVAIGQEGEGGAARHLPPHQLGAAVDAARHRGLARGGIDHGPWFRIAGSEGQPVQPRGAGSFVGCARNKATVEPVGFHPGRSAILARADHGDVIAPHGGSLDVAPRVSSLQDDRFDVPPAAALGLDQAVEAVGLSVARQPERAACVHHDGLGARSAAARHDAGEEADLLLLALALLGQTTQLGPRDGLTSPQGIDVARGVVAPARDRSHSDHGFEVAGHHDLVPKGGHPHALEAEAGEVAARSAVRQDGAVDHPICRSAVSGELLRRVVRGALDRMIGHSSSMRCRPNWTAICLQTLAKKSVFVNGMYKQKPAFYKAGFCLCPSST